MAIIVIQPTDHTDAVNAAIKAEYDKLIARGFTQDKALAQACRTVLAALDHTRTLYAQELDVRAIGDQP